MPTFLKRYFHLLALFFILLLAIFFRFYHLGSIPSGFYVDEAAIGYNAFSILKTGRDEFGQRLPLLLRSFTVFGAPVYSYLLIPLYAVLGVSPFTTRFLSAFCGVISVLLFYSLIRLLSQSRSFALLSAFLLAISPWHLIFSRATYETTLALTCLLVSLYCFYLARLRPPFYLLWGLFAALGFLSYPAHRVIVPLLYLVLIIIDYRQFFHSRQKTSWIIAAFVLATLIVAPTLQLVFTPGFASRLTALNIFSSPPWGSPDFLTPLLSLRQWLALYFAYFSPRNLFLLGDPGPRPSFVDLAPFFLWQLPFWLLGFGLLFKKIKTKKLEPLDTLILALLFISPLPASITRDPFSAIRSLPLVLPHLLLITSGLLWLKSKLNHALFVATFTVVILFSLARVYLSVFRLTDYFRYRAWDYGVSQLVDRLGQYPNTSVIVDNSAREIYIQLLFFLHFDPATYQSQNFEISQSDYYQNMNRVLTKHLGPITVRGLDWQKDLYRDQILVGDNLAISQNQIKEHCLTKLFDITGPDGQVVFQAVKTDPVRKNLMNQKNTHLQTPIMDCDQLVPQSQ